MNIQTFKPIGRRTFLRGVGASLALPWLESMTTTGLRAETSSPRVPRMGMFYFGTGMNMRQFYPEGTGVDAKLSRILSPLEPHRGKFTVLSNTWLEHGGGHDGAYPFATSIERGVSQTISPDQLSAEIHGQETRFPSLQLSVKRGTGLGSQALATISWNRQGAPLPAENDPKALFDRLFRPSDPGERNARDREFRRRDSVLDAVMDDARRVQKKLSRADQGRLDQYFNSIREVERGLEREIAWADKPKPEPKLGNLGDYNASMKPEGNGEFLYDTYARLMYDLIALAFETDSTRVVSYVVRTELAGGVYPEFGVSKGYHELTHHGNDPKNLEELAQVDTIYMRHWSAFLERLDSIREGDGSLLDHTMLGFSSGMGIGHSRDLLPTVLSGGGGLGIHHQTHLELAEKTPLSAVWRTMTEKMGVPVEGRFQDSEAGIRELVG